MSMFRRYDAWVRFEDQTETLYPITADSFETARTLARLMAEDESKINPIVGVQIMLKLWTPVIAVQGEE